MVAIRRFNDWLALTITSATGTMWCAYVFAALAFVAFPGFNDPKTFAIWLAQTFIQLVMLSVIIVGQRVQSERQEQHQASISAIHEHLGIGGVDDNAPNR
jgi:hypothetical protein